MLFSASVSFVVEGRSSSFSSVSSFLFLVINLKLCLVAEKTNFLFYFYSQIFIVVWNRNKTSAQMKHEPNTTWPSCSLFVIFWKSEII